MNSWKSWKVGVYSQFLKKFITGNKCDFYETPIVVTAAVIQTSDCSKTR